MDYVNLVLSEVNAAKTIEKLNVAKAKYNYLLTMKDETLKVAVMSNIGAAIESKENEINNNVDENTPMWIASKTSTVYHDSKEYSNMASPIQITLKHARERGLKPCSKCNPPR